MTLVIVMLSNGELRDILELDEMDEWNRIQDVEELVDRDMEKAINNPSRINTGLGHKVKGLSDGDWGQVDSSKSSEVYLHENDLVKGPDVDNIGSKAGEHNSE